MLWPGNTDNVYQTAGFGPEDSAWGTIVVNFGAEVPGWLEGSRLRGVCLYNAVGFVFKCHSMVSNGLSPDLRLLRVAADHMCCSPHPVDHNSRDDLEHRNSDSGDGEVYSDRRVPCTTTLLLGLWTTLDSMGWLKLVARTASQPSSLNTCKEGVKSITQHIEAISLNSAHPISYPQAALSVKDCDLPFITPEEVSKRKSGNSGGLFMSTSLDVYSF